MKTRPFITLLAVTVVAVGLAAAAVIRQPDATAPAGVGEQLFPDLEARLNDIARVVIHSPDGTVSLTPSEHEWRIVERDGYPASFETLKALIVGMLDLRKLEPKTGSTARYASLGVEDAGAAGAASKQVELLDAGGAPIARLIVGKPYAGLGAQEAVYVRIADEPQAWLATGQITVGDRPRDWIERRVINLPSAEVVRVELAHAGGSKLALVKHSPDEAAFRVENLPAGASVKRPELLGQIASALSLLEIEDVARSDAVAGAAKPTRATFTTADGLVVTAEVWEQDGEPWMRLAASTTPEAAQNPAVQGRAEEINARTKAWAYRAPAWKVEPLKKRLSDLTDGGDPGSPSTVPR